MRHTLLTILFLLCLLPAVRAAEPSNTEPGDTITVIVSGTGTDEKAALKQAFSNAVQQAVGVIVDAETVVKDDQIITDQVLTASNAIITHYDQVGSPKSEGGLVTVKIRADVQRKQLTERLQAANVVSKAVEGKDVFAQVVTDLQREKDTTAIVRRLFQDFPASVWKAEPTGQPRVISKTDTEATVGITVQISCDQTKYAQWLKTVTPFLARLATKSEQRRLNPKDAGMMSLDQYLRPASGLKISSMEVFNTNLPVPVLHASYFVPNEFDVIPNAQSKTAVLALIERLGSSRYVVYEIDQAARKEALRATFSLNMLDVTLNDKDGGEIDGQTQPLPITAFLTNNLKLREFHQDNPNDKLTAEWAPSKYAVENDANGIVFSPYVGANIFVEEQTTSVQPTSVLLSVSKVELQFTLPLERLKELKTVEARLSNKNNVPTNQ